MIIPMDTKELIPLLIHVVSSWEVIAVSIAILLYFFIVSSVGRTHGRRRKHSFNTKPKKSKPAPASAEPVIQEDSNDDLGLDEG